MKKLIADLNKCLERLQGIKEAQEIKLEKLNDKFNDSSEKFQASDKGEDMLQLIGEKEDYINELDSQEIELSGLIDELEVLITDYWK